MTDPAALYADIGGIAEIAEALEVTIHCVRRWIERRESTNCPKPVRQLKTGNLYSLAEWHAWHALWKVTRGAETWWHGETPKEKPKRKQRGIRGLPKRKEWR